MRNAVFLLLLLVTSAHAGGGNPASMRKVSAADLPAVVPDGDLGAFKLALQRQLAHCETQDGREKFYFEKRRVSRKDWCLDTGRAFLRLASEEGSFAGVWRRARTEFDWYQSVGREGRGDVLFTGYNFPSLEGRRVPDAVFRYPLYRKPADLVQVKEDGKLVWRRKTANGRYERFFSRREIDTEGALRGRGLELAYVADLYEATIFQVQGAGAVLLREPDGRQSRMILNYAAQNGHKYVAIGKVLKDKGVDPAYLTIPGMRRYFAEHPAELVPVLNENPSYVFFQEAAEGPLGTEVLLTPGHSIAIDPAHFPYGALAFFTTSRPVDSGATPGWQDFSRLAVTQDTGGAITGPGRVDIYWGEDSYAELAAGYMKQPGTLYFAVARKR